MVLFIMLYKVVLTFESVDKVLQSDHRSESYIHFCTEQYFPKVLVLIFKQF